MTRQFRFIGLLLLMGTFGLAACGGSGPIGPSSFGNEGRVATVDSGTTSRLSTSLTGADFKRFAEGMTNKILVSQAEGWSANKPRLVVGDIENNTDDENIRVIDIYDGIQEKLLESQTVRVLDRSATDFDYVIKPAITNTRQRDKETRQELVFYTMKMKLFKLDGELVGQWSDDMAFADAGKTWF
ncbi:MAG: hypothetical protein ACR2QF_15860 [Geminicoccaceae bacterium]